MDGKLEDLEEVFAHFEKVGTWNEAKSFPLLLL